MKTIKFFIAAIIAVMLTAGANAQMHDHNAMTAGKTMVKTESFKVWGNCDESCKARIEKNVLEIGATSADWSNKTKILKVTYDPAKTNIDAMQKKLASVGHDTKKYKATDEVYAKLPDCCHYDRK